MDDPILRRAAEVERCVAAVEAAVADPSAPDEAFHGAVDAAVREFQAGGLAEHHQALWERYQTARKAFAGRAEARREASARAADAMVADVEAARRAVEAAEDPAALGLARAAAADVRRRAQAGQGVLPADRRRVSVALDGLREVLDRAVASTVAAAREREARLSAAIDELHRLLAADDVRRDAFLAACAKADALFREGGLGDRHRELRDEFSECRRAFRAREETRLAASAEVAGRVVALATRAADAARAASAGPDVVAAKGMAREAREALSGGPSLARPDRDRVRAALEAMSVAIDEATARSDGVQREAVDAAVAAAADAIEAGDLGSAWGRFRSAREAVVGARISPEARRKLHEELDGLYARLQERREQARTEWRAHQERKREEFREKADRARDFVERQEEAAARCLHQAEEARSDEYADRMRRYAAEHQAKATEARGAVERMETILADIERQLAAGRPDRKRRADRGRGPDERPPAMVPAPPPEAVPAPPPKAVPAPPPEAVPDTPPEAVPDCAPEIADGPP